MRKASRLTHRTQAHRHAHAITHAITHARTHARTHTHTHTHTQDASHPCARQMCAWHEPKASTSAHTRRRSARTFRSIRAAVEGMAHQGIGSIGYGPRRGAQRCTRCVGELAGAGGPRYSRLAAFANRAAHLSVRAWRGRP